jgi:AcrR family transcriptional regulator
MPARASRRRREQAAADAAPRRRGRPPLADREGLLDAAERAIRRSGAKVSLERIAAAAGVTKPVLFAHVGDRRALVDALAERLLARIEKAVASALAAGAEGRDALERLIEAQLATVGADRNLYAFVNGAGSGDTNLTSTLAFAQRSAAPLVAGIAATRRSRGLDASVGEPWGHAVIGALHMVSLWWLAEPRRELDAPRLAAQLTELLWDGLAPSHGATKTHA